MRGVGSYIRCRTVSVVQKPLGRLAKVNLQEYFRRVAIRLFPKKELINAHLATSLINWKHDWNLATH